jgi:hypothetical protein
MRQNADKLTVAVVAAPLLPMSIFPLLETRLNGSTGPFRHHDASASSLAFVASFSTMSVGFPVIQGCGVWRFGGQGLPSFVPAGRPL